MTMIRDGAGDVITPNNPLAVRAEASGIAQPVDIQARYAELIQTHNAVSIALSGWSEMSSWINADKFDKLAVTLTNDANTNNSMLVFWSNDGVNKHGEETVLSTFASMRRAGIIDIKAPYFKISLNNGDATLAHTMSAWVYLKA